MNATGKRRLLKLADFLSKMPREKFNFGVFMQVYGLPPKEALKKGHHRCGTVGCAIGWTPVVFPRLLKYDGSNMPALKESRRRDIGLYSVAATVFDITYAEAIFLFSPDGNMDFGGENLYSNLDYQSTPKKVAQNIRRFIRLKEKHPNVEGR